MSDGEDVSVSVHGKVSTVRMSRPLLNILSMRMMDELYAAFEQLNGNRSVHVVVLESGIAGVFSAGADVKEHLPGSAEKMISTFERMVTRIVSMEVPTIAVVRGKCLGGGMELALSCDFVLADESASFGQPEVNVGVYAPVAAALYPRIAGLRNSYRILLTGETFSAREAQAMGIVSEVVESERLEAEVQKLVDVLCRQSRVVLGFTMKAINDNLCSAPEEAIKSASRLYVEGLMQTGDAKEGLAAFLEKRKPVWKDE